jgi:hypothetical protein
MHGHMNVKFVKFLFSLEDINAPQLEKTRRHISANASEFQMVLSLKFSDLAIFCLHLQGRRRSLIYNVAIYRVTTVIV